MKGSYNTMLQHFQQLETIRIVSKLQKRCPSHCDFNTSESSGRLNILRYGASFGDCCSYFCWRHHQQPSFKYYIHPGVDSTKFATRWLTEGPIWPPHVTMTLNVSQLFDPGVASHDYILLCNFSWRGRYNIQKDTAVQGIATITPTSAMMASADRFMMKFSWLDGGIQLIETIDRSS